MKRLLQRKKNIIKLFPQRAKVFCNYINDISNRSHNSFNNLFNLIHAHLIAECIGNKRKEHDAKFLASALIWAYEDKTLRSPHFITTDWGDICKNRSAIYNFAVSCLSENCLKIRFIFDMIS